MLRLLADENLPAAVVSGMRRRLPGLDLVTVQELAFRGRTDPVLVDWCIQEGRVLVTQDIRTIPPLIGARIASGQPVCGVIIVKQHGSLADTLFDLEMICLTTSIADWTQVVAYIPF
jgi:hypothetical protein